MMPAPALSDSGALDYGVDANGDDVYTLRFDEAVQLAIPVPSNSYDSAEGFDRTLDKIRATVEALLGRELTDYQYGGSVGLFPLFSVWLLTQDGKSVRLNHRPTGAPPPPAANW